MTSYVIEEALLAGALTSGLCALALQTQRLACANADGWRTLRPNWLLNLGIAGTFGLAALTGYIVLFVGSDRPDPEQQMLAALLICLASVAATLWQIWVAYGRLIQWKDGELRVRSLGREAVYPLAEVRGVRVEQMNDSYRALFRDGSVLRFSTYFHGARELAALLQPAENGVTR